jgi:hypothetical protein
LPGNEVAVKHGARRSDLALSKEREFAEILTDVRERVPGYSYHDESAVQLLALTLTRVKKASVALDKLDPATEARELQRLREDMRGWVNTSVRLLDALGMTPTSRARLGFDLVRTEDALAQLAAEGREARARAERQLGDAA